jgi:hypothetical protein
MIFGFNTDVKHDDTVYHVQSEARHAELMLQTQVFVRGRCIGKRTTSYADRSAEPEFSDQQMEQMLRNQHRLVVDAAREGKIETVLDLIGGEGKGEETAASSLKLEWLNVGSVRSEDSVLLRLRVTDGGNAVEGVQLTSRFAPQEGPPIYAQAVTDAHGQAEIRIPIEEAALTHSAVLVQASHGGRSATRKFRLRKSSL